MIGLQDIPKFFLAFFLVLPIISLLHEMGHVFFAWLMGGKKIRIIIGSGKPLFSAGTFEIRQYYFWYGLCTFENLKRSEKWANILIFSGGAVFNLLGTSLIMILVQNEVLEAGILTYQFTYFSLYYIFFALLPMPYPDGNYSDGKIILDLLRGKKNIIMERTYRIEWNGNKNNFYVQDYDQNFVGTFENEKDATEKAKKLAKQNPPSRVIISKEGEETEIKNYPRIPL